MTHRRIIPWHAEGGAVPFVKVERCWGLRRLVTVVGAATLLSAQAVAQDVPEGDLDPQPTAGLATIALLEPPYGYWPLLLTGIGLTAGGLLGARLAYLETELWEAIPAGTAERQRRIDEWSTATVTGSVAAAVGVGLIALWATIRLSQQPAPTDR